MNPIESLGKTMLVVGGVLVLIGLAVLFLSRVPLIGRLPGDFHFRWGNVSCYAPLATGIILSILATLVLNLVLWLLRK
jgi:hypothetical protein